MKELNKIFLYRANFRPRSEQANFRRFPEFVKGAERKEKHNIKVQTAVIFILFMY